MYAYYFNLNEDITIELPKVISSDNTDCIKITGTHQFEMFHESTIIFNNKIDLLHISHDAPWLEASVLQLKLNFYLNARHFFIALSHVHFRFWCHERLSDRSISKCYTKSNTSPWVEKSSTSQAFHTHNTWFYWSSENALHERLPLSMGVWVWMERVIAHHLALKKR